MTAKQKEWINPATLISTASLLVMLLSAAGFVRKPDIAELKQARDIEVAAMKAKQTVDNNRLERKLDCALWNLPKNCRELLAPHEVGQ